ncbi:Nat2 protein [Saccharomycopsis crataegensis]|uniref:Nat2 protein n=1 Tax=Saccharomycopsis crataegensis TaxID=43959 RepID=A0AAV5QKI9_9ASCO|nr:Nat2 protein [Saccharomycopsis crataegensis]
MSLRVFSRAGMMLGRRGTIIGGNGCHRFPVMGVKSPLAMVQPKSRFHWGLQPRQTKDNSQTKNDSSNSSTEDDSSAGKKKEKGIKALMKKYGYAALGVYLGLSVLDLPFCYLFVASVGGDKITEWKDQIWQFFGISRDEHSTVNDDDHDGVDKDNDERNKKDEGWGKFLTTFAIAYGVHKSLVFIRLPITAWITPSVVKTLQGWGFNVGKKTVQEAYKAAAAKSGVAKTAGSNKVNEELFGKVVGKSNDKKRWWNFFL